MKRKSWLYALLALAALVVLLTIFLRLRPTAPPPPTPYSILPTSAWSHLPTVTPPGPGEPTVPPEALTMRAAPTATPGAPPLYPSPIPTPTWPPTPTPVSPGATDDVPMVEVPAGEFIMGTTEEEVARLEREWREKCGKRCVVFYRFANEAPQMVVYLDSFSIDQYKVTNARYRHCVEAGVCSLPHPLYHEVLWDPRYDNYAVQVNWYNANAYCQWVGKRLPTEAEWEKAARGTDGRLYPWGNEHDLGRYAYNPDAHEPVDRYPQGASPYGVIGLLDRPPEWTIDWYRAYPGNAAIYPGLDTSDMWGSERGLYARGYRAVRGLGLPEEEAARASVRNGYDPTSNYPGFRCVRGPQPRPLEQALVRSTAPTPVPTPAPAATVDLSQMIYVPAGPFIMGSDEVPSDDPYLRASTPQHIVYLDAFYIDRTEVTRREFATFLNALGTHRRACGGYDCGMGGVVLNPDSGKYIAGVITFDGKELHYVEDPTYAPYPAMGVTWYGAQAYCAWVGKRLPTEAEWEKAARGTDGRRYPWGNEPIPEFLEEYREPVGSRPGNASPYGMLDALGNVMEWVADWYDPAYYAYSPYRNPPGPPSGEEKVIRGPVMGLDDITLRDHESPRASFDIGFRCAYSPAQ